MARLAVLGPLLGAAWMLGGCGGLRMEKPVQGISGTILIYGPPRILMDCKPFVTQADIDSCRHQNARVLEEPYQTTIRIRNLATGENIRQPLDERGSYRVLLNPGEYSVCVDKECSDPLEVSMGRFKTYGLRLPRPAADSAEAKNAPKSSAGS